MSLLNPTNYLDLLQRFSVDVGATDDPPATAQDPEGQVQEFCNLLNQAWIEIQCIHPDWKFNRSSASFTTIVDQTSYTPTQAGIARGVLNGWKEDSFRSYLTTSIASEMHMTPLDYDEWRDTYLIGSMRTARVQPIVFAVGPTLSLHIPCPLAGYTIIGDYYSAPLGFDADADIPSIPAEFIMLIVYKAMINYGTSESAPDLIAKGQFGYGPLMARLESSRLPQVRTVGALA